MTKNKKDMNTISKIIIFILLISVSVSCEKFLDVNDDPNAPANVALDLRLKPTILMANGAAQWRGTREVAAIMQYVASSNGTGGFSATRWEFTNSYFVWQNTLVWTYPNAIDMIVMGEDQNSPYFSGVGKIFKAYLLFLLTDQLGSIPFDDLYNGRDQAILEPRFEEQEVVYEKCLAVLDEAIIDLSETENEISLNGRGGDIIYEGDSTKWVKFAYALKARYLNHYTKKPSLYNPAAVIAACENAFNDNEQDAEFPYTLGGGTTQANPWSSEGFGDMAGALGRYTGWSHFFVEMLKNSPLSDTIDPRMPIIMNPSVNDTAFRGIVSGRGYDKDPNLAFNDYSNVTGGFYTSGASPWPFITYAEVKFIEAEAKLRSGDVSGARDALKEGVSANMKKLGVDVSLRTIAENKLDALTDADFTPLEAGLYYIMTQKYIALVLHPETWVDMRRMDYSSTIYPGLTQPEDVNIIFGPGEWIKAMIYEYNEENRNPDNLPNNDPELRMTTPVWWDVAE